MLSGRRSVVILRSLVDGSTRCDLVKKFRFRKNLGNASQNFPKERLKAGNDFSMTRNQRRPKQ